MRKLTLAAALLASTAFMAMPAQADVMIEDKLSGTGDNVIFNSVTLGSLVQGKFNGQHQGLVDFSCLATCANFTGAQNGNDLKIENFQTLKVQVFDSTHTNVLQTQTDVFSITGTGDVTVFVQAKDQFGNDEALKSFDLTALFGQLGPGQNGFTLTAYNGETIDSFRLVDVGGKITDFEHYRIDVANMAAVPGPVAGAGPIGLAAAVMFGLNFWRRRRNGENLKTV